MHCSLARKALDYMYSNSHFNIKTFTKREAEVKRSKSNRNIFFLIRP